MFTWFRKFLKKLQEKRQEEHILHRDGCVLYCRTCRAILNEHGSEDQHEVYVAKCQCGKISRFLLDAPAPILITHT